MSIYEYLDILLNVITIYLVAYGLFTRKRELHGKRRYEIAEQVFVAVKDYSKAMEGLRNSHSGSLNMADAGEAQTSNEAVFNIHVNRYNRMIEKRYLLNDILSKLEIKLENDCGLHCCRISGIKFILDNLSRKEIEMLSCIQILQRHDLLDQESDLLYGTDGTQEINQYLNNLKDIVYKLGRMK